MKSVARFIALALFAVTPAYAQGVPSVAPAPATLVVSTSAEVNVAPDMATLSAGVVTDGKSAADALAKNAARMTEVFAALKAAGIPDKDMQTSGISVNPQYAYADGQAPRVTGYQASNNVSVIVRKLEGLGSVIDALVGKGANQINGPSFGVDKPDPLLDGARAEAVAKARARAEIYAKAAGLRIKRILSITEGGESAPRPPMPMMRTMAMEASTPVAQGQVELSVSVTVTFELEQ